MNRTIGRFFAEEWQSAQQNTGIFFNSVPRSNMSLDELYQVRDKLTEMISFWEYQMQPDVNTAWEARANAGAIVGLERQRLDETQKFITAATTAATSVTTPPVMEALPTTEIDPMTGEPKPSWLPIILIGAVALYFFMKRKKRAA